MRDGFIDRYTGTRLINPGVLRLVHVVLVNDFQAHPHGKLSETHLAFWELFPDRRSCRADQPRRARRRVEPGDSVDAEQSGQGPVDGGGPRLKLHPPGAAAAWDGLSRWLVDYLVANPTVLAQESMWSTRIRFGTYLARVRQNLL